VLFTFCSHFGTIMAGLTPTGRKRRRTLPSIAPSSVHLPAALHGALGLWARAGKAKRCFSGALELWARTGKAKRCFSGALELWEQEPEKLKDAFPELWSSGQEPEKLKDAFELVSKRFLVGTMMVSPLDPPPSPSDSPPVIHTSLLFTGFRHVAFKNA
jgi:hypothetical protein